MSVYRRRAPRAVRRGRKFRARPTSHDGLSVIAAYGNRAGYTRDGTVAGRVGLNRILCRDGTVLSVIAGFAVMCSPKPMSGFDHDDKLGYVPADYRGPYHELEVLISTPRQREPRGYVPVAAVRALIDRHGGFGRMEKSPVVLAEMRRWAVERARHEGEVWGRRG